jgi:X-X-X-Leu-X-X-Gly heptad repeat protein
MAVVFPLVNPFGWVTQLVGGLEVTSGLTQLVGGLEVTSGGVTQLVGGLTQLVGGLTQLVDSLGLALQLAAESELSLGPMFGSEIVLGAAESELSLGLMFGSELVLERWGILRCSP